MRVRVRVRVSVTRAPDQASCELDALLGLLQAATFVPAGGKPSFGAPATHARADAPAAAAAGAAAGAAAASAIDAAPSSAAAAGLGAGLGPLLRLLGAVARYQHGSRHS